MNKEKFIDYMIKLTDTMSTINKLGDLLGGICINDCQLVNYLDQSAELWAIILGVGEEEEYYEDFVEDFWFLASSCHGLNAGVYDWGEFYDFYTSL